MTMRETKEKKRRKQWRKKKDAKDENAYKLTKQ